MKWNRIAALTFVTAGIFLGAFALAGSGSLVRPGLVSDANTRTAAAATNEWAVVQSPNKGAPGTVHFNDVACTSATDCWAVGGAPSAEGLIEHWDGYSWSIVPLPAPGASEYRALNAVTCTSATDCWAVGQKGYWFPPVALHWDGNAWEEVELENAGGANGGGATLRDVACVSASDCWAVGNGPSGPYLSDPQPTFIQHWDGVAWKIVASPDGDPEGKNYLESVTCRAGLGCWAVGYSEGGFPFRQDTLIERWNGTSWSVVASPPPKTDGSERLRGVTCASASNCWAVGNSGNQVLTERWNGTSWSIQPSGDDSNSPVQLHDVTCASDSDCWAVGDSYRSYGKSLLKYWNGSSWSTVFSQPSPATDPFDYSLHGVACTAAGNCWAVGDVVKHWDGLAWSVNASPLFTLNFLTDVSCTSANDCWAVGSYENGGSYYDRWGLTQHWDGVGWRIVDSELGPGDLWAVDCPSGSLCWAVGETGNSSLIERWNGAAWSIEQTGALPGTPPSVLRDVTCTSESDCWAVGYNYSVTSATTPRVCPDRPIPICIIGEMRFTRVNYNALLQRWNGTSWAASPPPTVPNATGLEGVTCNSPTDCWAVGFLAATRLDTFIAHYDGTVWLPVTSPSTPGANDDVLLRVACSAASDCWAVGFYRTPDNKYKTLLEHWDGSSWSIFTAPGLSDTANLLTDVTCVAGGECWAVGYSGLETLTARWDGTNWSITASPTPDGAAGLLGITCRSASDCWAAGVSGTTIGETLLLHYGPLLSLRIKDIRHLANGQVSILGEGVANSLISIEASPDLLHQFVSLGSTLANANGSFEYIDTQAATFSQKFYRATYP